MKMKTGLKSIAAAAIAAFTFGFAPRAEAATITVTQAQQRYPWAGQFDITYTASGIAEACGTKKIASLKVWAVNPATQEEQIATDAALSGDTVMADGEHSLVWDMDAQKIFQGVTNKIEIYITAMTEDKPETHEGVQLWANGPYFATMNIGATKPEEYGYYFWWGDTVGYKYNGTKWVSSDGKGTTISFSDSDTTANQTYNKDIATLKSDGWIDTTKGNLVAAHDAATAHWGSKWRTMTKDELDKLVDTKVCTTTWTTQGGVKGRIVKGTGAYASNEIFLPAAGYGYSTYYWGTGTYTYYMTSTPVTSSVYYSYLLYFNVNYFRREDSTYRCSGFSVRPVSDDPPTTEVAANGDPEPLCTGEIDAAADLRTGVPRNAAATEALPYNKDWWQWGVSMKIFVDGKEKWTGLTDSGTVEWTPDPNYVGTYKLELKKFYSNGAVCQPVYTAYFNSPKEELALKDAEGNTVDVKLNRSWAEEKTGETDPTAQATALNVKQDNGHRKWENEVLGLNGSVSTSIPVISPVQTSNAGLVGFRLSGVNVDTTSGASVSNKVWKGSTPGEHTTGYGPYLYTEQVDVPVPESGVQYYDIEVLIK